MLRRLHTRILGMGSVCGMPPSPMAEVFLKSLPPPVQVDLVKYHRFEQEEANRMRVPRCTTSPEPAIAPEPFYDIQSGAAGHKHVVLITREGNLITFGENRYGQSAAPGESVRGGGRLGENRQQPLAKHSDQHVSAAPMYVDLDGAFAGGNKSVACGSNYTIVYQPGGRRAIGFGNNHMGQLGIGHKNQVDASRGFAEWDPTAAWWGGNTNVIRTIACGFNHTILQLSSGDLLSFGSNTWGELGIGSTVSPMQPTPIRFFEEKGIVVVKTVAGNSFTLFLTADGRVYGCGATNAGQLPANVFEPAPVLLTRSFQQGCKVVPGSVHGGPTQPKLIRIKDIACVGSMAVYASRKNELFVQGALPDYGYQVPSPRFQLVDQQPAIDYLTEMMEHNKKKGGTRWMDDKGSEAHTGFDIVRLVQGPSTLLVIYKNGCVAGLGANAEGQLQNIRRSQKGKEVNLAKAFTANGLLPVCFPSKPYEAGGKQTAALPWFTCGAGFTLLFDNNEVYDDGGQVKPIELPPPAPTSRRGAAAALRSMR